MTTILYGIHPIVEALKTRPGKFHHLFIARQRRTKQLQSILSLAQQCNIKVSPASSRELSLMCSTSHHQGVAAEVEPFATVDLRALLFECRQAMNGVLLLVLDSIQDPQNFGSLVRVAYCSGVQGIIFPKDRAAPLSGSVAKSSAGAIEHIQLCRVVNIAAAIDKLKSEGIWVAGMFPKAPLSIYEFDFRMDIAIIIGSESTGIRPLVKRKCDFLLSIPLKGTLNSLNAATSGAVVLFEIMRQRNRGH